MTGESPGGLRAAIEALVESFPAAQGDGPRAWWNAALAAVLALPEVAALGRTQGAPEAWLVLYNDQHGRAVKAAFATQTEVHDFDMGLSYSRHAAIVPLFRAVPAPATAPAIDFREMCKDEYRGPGQTARAATMLQKTISDWIVLTPAERAWVYACLSDEPPATAPVQPEGEERLMDVARRAFCAGYLCNGPTDPALMLKLCDEYVAAVFASPPAVPASAPGEP